MVVLGLGFEGLSGIYVAFGILGFGSEDLRRVYGLIGVSGLGFEVEGLGLGFNWVVGFECMCTI